MSITNILLLDVTIVYYVRYPTQYLRLHYREAPLIVCCGRAAAERATRRTTLGSILHIRCPSMRRSIIMSVNSS